MATLKVERYGPFEVPVGKGLLKTLSESEHDDPGPEPADEMSRGPEGAPLDDIVA